MRYKKIILRDLESSLEIKLDAEDAVVPILGSPILFEGVNYVVTDVQYEITKDYLMNTFVYMASRTD
jgi:hypothetical protein